MITTKEEWMKKQGSTERVNSTQGPVARDAVMARKLTHHEEWDNFLTILQAMLHKAEAEKEVGRG